MFDIVFPNKNEKEFIQLAEKLGFKGLVFVYENKTDFKEFKKEKIKIINILLTKKQTPEINLIKGIEDSREILERYKPNILFAVESAQKRDFMHQRGSGLNHILCRIAKNNNTLIAFSFNTILNNSNLLRAQIIGRMIQNIKLCRKFKNKTLIASFAKSPFEMRSAHDLISFFTSIGMHPKEAKDSLNEISKINKGKIKGIDILT